MFLRAGGADRQYGLCGELCEAHLVVLPPGDHAGSQRQGDGESGAEGLDILLGRGQRLVVDGEGLSGVISSQIRNAKCKNGFEKHGDRIDDPRQCAQSYSARVGNL